MRYLGFVAALLCACAMASPALAQPYVSLYGGASFLSDADIEPGTVVDEAAFDNGFVAGGTVGHAIHDVFDVRVELDLSYRSNGLDEGSSGGASVSADGDVTAVSLLSNYWLDIPASAAVTPYVGLGVGASYLSADDVEIGGTRLVDDSTLVFAWQLGAGVAFEVARNWALSVDYRWFNTSDPEFEDVNGADFDSEYSSHNVLAGVRYSF